VISGRTFFHHLRPEKSDRGMKSFPKCKSERCISLVAKFYAPQKARTTSGDAKQVESDCTTYKLLRFRSHWLTRNRSAFKKLCASQAEVTGEREYSPDLSPFISHEKYPGHTIPRCERMIREAANFIDKLRHLGGCE
jgi:hypothetical protein